MSKKLTRICVRVYTDDLETMKEICALQKTEFNHQFREVIHTYCVHARANAAKHIDRIKPSDYAPHEVHNLESLDG